MGDICTERPRAGEEKPYRVYRGGRAKAKNPIGTTTTTAERARERAERRRSQRDPAPVPSHRRSGRRIALFLLLLCLATAAWLLASYRSVASGVAEANARLAPAARAALSPSSGFGSTALLLGTDHSATIRERAGAQRSDSMMLVRTDPSGRTHYLSLPRDLLVEVPGYGQEKINVASQLGGPALAIRTVSQLTGIKINHVAVVDFGSFEQLVDAVGGITITVPKPILSKPFDCPFSADRCQSWQGWRFGKGEQTMDGRRALVYSRIRVNQLDAAETDMTRAERQQAVTQAITRKLTSPLTLVKLPANGNRLVAPLSTDMSARELAALAWAKFRGGKGGSLHCRLGGEPVAGWISPTEANRDVVAMFLGRAAPKPPPASSLYAPGCRKSS